MFSSIRSGLFLLAALTVLPKAVLMAYISLKLADSAEERARQDLAGLARFAAHDVAEHLNKLRIRTSIVARFTDLHSARAGACQTLIDQLMRDAADLDGIERIHALERVPGAAWSVVVGLPTEEVFSPLRRLLTHLILLGLMTVAAMLLLAWFAARRIALPARRCPRRIRRPDRNDGRQAGVLRTG